MRTDQLEQDGWKHLARHVPGDLRRAFEAIRANPRSATDPARHHRSKGSLGKAPSEGEQVERWQYEVTGGGRIRHLIDDPNRAAWITHAGTGHPGATD
ncbi:hypothetical protein [Planomonospora alba]